MERDKAAMNQKAIEIAVAALKTSNSCDYWLTKARLFDVTHKMAIATPAEIMAVEAAARILAKFESEAEGRVAAFLGAAQ